MAVLQNEVTTAYRNALDRSHNGHPTFVYTVPTGGRGRPRLWIDPGWLRVAYSHRGPTEIARIIGCSVTTVRKALIAHGIRAPLDPGNVAEDGPSDGDDQDEADIQMGDWGADGDEDGQSEDDGVGGMDSEVGSGSEDGSVDDHTNDGPARPARSTAHFQSFTAPVSTLTDEQLDYLIRLLHLHFPESGNSRLSGMLKNLGQNVPMSRIRQSRFRIDPVRRVFGQKRILRRVYSVAGPNALWHHDGQHGTSLSGFSPTHAVLTLIS